MVAPALDERFEPPEMLRFSMIRRSAILLLACVGPLAMLVALPVAAQLAEKASIGDAGLLGAWSGGGKIILPSGDTERARCRAHFRQSGRVFQMSAICATASIKVQQTADLGWVGGNRYTGQFFNAEYGVSGSIIITLHGRRLVATLNGGGAAAQLVLNR
jgi:hypothetical protein